MIDVVAVVNLIRLLHTDPMDMKTLTEKSGLCRQTTTRWIKYFRSTKIKLSGRFHPLVRIADYKATPRGAIPKYQWNLDDEKDAVFVKKTNAEKAAQYRARKKLLNQINMKGI